jgi:hypothetical protein
MSLSSCFSCRFFLFSCCCSITIVFSSCRISRLLNPFIHLFFSDKNTHVSVRVSVYICIHVHRCTSLLYRKQVSHVQTCLVIDSVRSATARMTSDVSANREKRLTSRLERRTVEHGFHQAVQRRQSMIENAALLLVLGLMQRKTVLVAKLSASRIDFLSCSIHSSLVRTTASQGNDQLFLFARVM